MSDTQTALRDAALLTAGVAAAGLLAARPADARTGSSRSARRRSARITGTNGTTYAPATLYFSASPGTGAVQVPSVSKNNATASTDVQVLNFALALETLEAELYRQAVLRLTVGGTDQLGNHITGLMVATTEADVKYLSEFATIESDHQKFLEGALGNNWVLDAKAVFDFGFADTNSFGNPPLTRQQTVELVYAAELTGVSAYLGGAGVLTPGSANLTYAAAILGTEARHTAAVAILLNSNPPFNENPKIETAPLSFENNGRDSPLTPDQILNTGGQLQGGITGTTLGQTGFINPVSGPSGFVLLPTGGTTIVLL